MDNLPFKIPDETKLKMQEKGMRAYRPTNHPNWADPDHTSYHVANVAMIGASLYARKYCQQIKISRWPFTAVIMTIPCFYVLALHKKEKRVVYDGSPRKTFEQNLEFYPITRRAFNRAKAIREQELGKSL